MAQSRLDSRIKKVIESAILHRAFTEEEMLKKGIELKYKMKMQLSSICRK